MSEARHLITAPNIADRDDFYERLLRAHQGLDEKKSQALNARLVLILANHIGDKEVLEEALALAEKSGAADGS